LGFGHSSRIQYRKILRPFEDLRVVIEIVDDEDKITPFVATLDGVVVQRWIGIPL
jgi:PII-like signaling protein